MNGKSIKLWKIFDKSQKKVTKTHGGKENMFPKYTNAGTLPSVSLQYIHFYEENNTEKTMKKNSWNLIFQRMNSFCFHVILKK